MKIELGAEKLKLEAQSSKLEAHILSWKLDLES